MVNIAQLVEHQIVALGAVGSNPTIHPKKYLHQRIKTIRLYRKLVGVWRNW